MTPTLRCPIGYFEHDTNIEMFNWLLCIPGSALSVKGQVGEVLLDEIQVTNGLYQECTIAPMELSGDFSW